MFLFRSVFVIALILASNSGVMALFVPLWHYAMIAEGPDGALSTVSVIDATGTAPPCPMITPTTPTSSLADISPTPTALLPVEQSTVIDAQNPQASDTDDPQSPLTLSRTNGSIRPMLWGPGVLISLLLAAILL
ncbi:hypothetical protein QCA50_002974 [Cerrena zonata]|uniref:Uncharacterized protein n=1 Tax=Cerrena zonata TaxID=2478898 RepID=A0AAW0GV71_9APHY